MSIFAVTDFPNLLERLLQISPQLFFPSQTQVYILDSCYKSNSSNNFFWYSSSVAAFTISFVRPCFDNSRISWLILLSFSSLTTFSSKPAIPYNIRSSHLILILHVGICFLSTFLPILIPILILFLNFVEYTTLRKNEIKLNLWGF